MSLDLSKLGDDLLAAFGENAQEEKPWLDVGYPPLNKILSGSYIDGFPYGRMVEIFGPPACGKTLIATMAMVATQRAGGICILEDWERAFKAAFGAEMGLNTAYPHFIHRFPKTWEDGNQEALTIAKFIRDKKAIAPEAPICIVFDSIAAAPPKSKMYDSKGKLKMLDETTMNDTTALARATSSVLPSVVQWLEEVNAIAIYLNQIRTKPGIAYGDPNYTPGGVSPEFYATTRLSITQKKLMVESAGEKEFMGRVLKLTTVKSKSTKPFQTAELRLVYDERGKASFDFTTGMVEHLIEVGKLEEKSGRVTWDGKSYFKSVLVKKLDEEGLVPELHKMLHA